jgi:uncharacterized protein
MNEMVHDQIRAGPVQESQEAMVKRYARQIAEEQAPWAG